MKHIYTVTSKTKYYTNVFNLTYPNIAESISDGMLNELKLPYDKLPLCFEILEDGWFIKIPQPVQYSLNLVDWIDLPKNTNTPTLNTGQKIFFKGYHTNMTFGSSSGFGEMSIQQRRFNVYGNIMSLLYGDEFYGKYELPSNVNYLFYGLFRYAYSLLNAKNLILPATKLTKYCYKYMFGGCNKLQTIPELPATTLAEGCYEEMFGGCKLMCEPPELPVTTLQKSCYRGMFINCTSLTHTPELPATTLADYCYHEMFSGCTSLTTAPQLNSIELAESCYGRMFEGCTSLTNIQSILPASSLKTWCYYGMFRNCTSLTTAPELPATTINGQCYYGMFDGCKSLTTAPELPATKLYVNCYRDMFKNCTALTNVPNLPATKLAEGCYSYMFYKCTSLTNAPSFIATSFGHGSYAYMLYGTQFIPDVSNIDFSNASVIRSGICAGLFAGTNITDEYLNNVLPKNPETGNIWLPVTSLSSNCYEGMFECCKNITIVPELPALSVSTQSYKNMFKDCTSITTAPELPATTLSTECYCYMFTGCTSLVNVPELPATTLKSGCYYDMFQNCTSLVKAPELPATELAQSCYMGMFSGCTSLTIPPSKLLASTVYYRSYSNMFRDCTSLETSPEIRNITTFNSSECLSGMFYDCKNLKRITAVFEPNSSKMSSWVYNVANTGTFIKKSGTTWTIGSSGIPNGWQDIDDVTYVKRISFTITANDVSARKTTTVITYTDVWECLTDNGETIEQTLTGTAISEEFPQNTSKTETVQRTITYTHDGVTATTTITQGVWVDTSYSVNLNDNWRLSSNVTNPDESLYDGVYESFSNKGASSAAATMYIDIVGYETFTLYIRSYAESNFDYVMVSQLDKTITNNTTYSNTSLVKAHTRGNQKSGTTINDYTKVEFTGIDGDEHRISIVYRKDSSGNSGDDRGYVIIPKD